MCLALCLCFSVPALALNETSLTNDDVLSDDYIENLQSFYASARFKENYSTLMVSRSTQTVQMNYPENFGGIYIDNENKLHIAYVDGVDALDDSMQDYEVKYDVVKYSFNYLCQISSLLSDNMSDFNITIVSVDEMQNKLVVAIDKEFETELIEWLSENISNFDSNCISFVDPVSIASTDAGGTSIKSNGGFTLGYNARKSSTGKYGFVTCGHGVSAVGDTVKRNNFWGTSLGKVSNRRFGDTIDACFVTYSNQSNITTACLVGGNLTGTYSSSQITSGMIVDKYGATTNARSGRVTSGSASVSCDGVTFRDQVQMSIRQERGDSGAPVVHEFIGPMESGKIAPTTLVGIATFADSSTWNTAWASKAANINSAFGLSTYILII